MDIFEKINTLNSFRELLIFIVGLFSVSDYYPVSDYCPVSDYYPGRGIQEIIGNSNSNHRRVTVD